MPAAMMIEGLTGAQVARQLEVSEGLVRQMAMTGKLPFIATPHGRVYRPEDVERVAQARAQKLVGAAGEA